MVKKSTQKFEHLENEVSFQDEKKIHQGLSLKQIIHFFLRCESPTSKTFNNYTIIMTINSDEIRIL